MIQPQKTAAILTILTDTLEWVEPLDTTQAAFKRRLETNLLNNSDAYAFHSNLYFANNDQFVLAGEELTRAIDALERLEQVPLLAVADALQEVIERREEQDDLWPEGRLQLGVTYEAIGDYQKARDTFEEVIQICENGGRFADRAMAMAA